MLNSLALSILLIHRELFTEAKQLLRVAVDGISGHFSIRKEKGKIKGEIIECWRTQNDLLFGDKSFRA